jgi:hypothetical protein
MSAAMNAAAAWSALARELDVWAASGRRATLWWRDDDAVAPSPALDRLIDIAAQHRIPLALAVIPVPATPALAARLSAAGSDVAVLQHGFAHRSHAGAGEKKAELGAQRPSGIVLDELDRGGGLLRALFAGTGVATLPVLVPPWNRIAPSVVAGLCHAGFTGLSTYNPRPGREAAPGVLLVNTHADIVDWRGTRGFVGEATALGLITGHLSARREGRADADEPTGVMTHHLVHDDACWLFLTALAARLAAHPGAVWLDAPTIFNMRPADNLP